MEMQPFIFTMRMEQTPGQPLQKTEMNMFPQPL